MVRKAIGVSTMKLLLIACLALAGTALGQGHPGAIHLAENDKTYLRCDGKDVEVSCPKSGKWKPSQQSAMNDPILTPAPPSDRLRLYAKRAKMVWVPETWWYAGAWEAKCESGDIGKIPARKPPGADYGADSVVYCLYVEAETSK